MKRALYVTIGSYVYTMVTDKPVVEQKVKGVLKLGYNNTLVIEADDYIYIEGKYTTKLITNSEAKEIEIDNVKLYSKPPIKVYSLDRDLLALFPSVEAMSKIEGITLTSAKRILFDVADRAIVKNWHDIPVIYVIEESVDDILDMINVNYTAYTTPKGIKKVKVIN